MDFRGRDAIPHGNTGPGVGWPGAPARCSGQVVGQSATASGTTHGFLYANGVMVDLRVPAGATATTAGAINRLGQIAGQIVVNGVTHIGRYQNGAWTDLGMLAGATAGMAANGINASGQIVGNAVFPYTYTQRRTPTHVGFVTVNGAPVDLNTLIPSGTGYVIVAALGINDSGDILCNATTATRAFHSVLLTPR